MCVRAYKRTYIVYFIYIWNFILIVAIEFKGSKVMQKLDDEFRENQKSNIDFQLVNMKCILIRGSDQLEKLLKLIQIIAPKNMYRFICESQIIWIHYYYCGIYIQIMRNYWYKKVNLHSNDLLPLVMNQITFEHIMIVAEQKIRNQNEFDNIMRYHVIWY